MKKETISVSVDTEKIRVLNFYLGKRSGNIERELLDAFNKLYEKNVPAPTREYIDSLCETQIQPPARPRPKHGDRPVERTDPHAAGGSGEERNEGGEYNG